MGAKKPLDKIVLSDILVKDIEFSDAEPARSEQLLEFVRVASLQCVNALLRIRPIVVTPLPRGKWKILAGHSSFLVAKAFAQLSDTVTVVAVPDEGDAPKMIPIVDTLFSHMLNTKAPEEEVWDKCAREPLFVALGRDLTHPRVRGMLASKKVARKYDRAKAQDATTAEQPTGTSNIDPTASAQFRNGPGTAPGGMQPDTFPRVKRSHVGKNLLPKSTDASAEQHTETPDAAADQSYSAGDGHGDQDPRPMGASERGNPTTQAQSLEAPITDNGGAHPDAAPAQDPSPS